MLTFAAVAAKYRPKWVVWENVPGVLSSEKGCDFAEFLGLLSGQGIEPPADGWGNSGVIVGYKNAYSLAWRVLDAQYFGVAQRRRRVFVVGCLGDWRSAAAVLFERHSLSGNPAPSRKTGEAIAKCLTTGVGTKLDFETEDFVTSIGAHKSGSLPAVASGKPTIGTLMANAGTKLWSGNQEAFTGDYHILQPVAFSTKDYGNDAQNDLSPTLLNQSTGVGVAYSAMAFDTTQITSKTNRSQPTYGAPCHTLSAGGCEGGGKGYLGQDEQAFTVSTGQDQFLHKGASQVRRLMPIECERLQGFPDGYTLITHKGKPAADSPRYKALGNSWAVPVVKWIGERIVQVEKA
jgi:DNA (cytosine-5)-methyltransferase 1